LIEFILNRHNIKTELPSGSTVLDFVRYHRHLPGTKIGCREGDCGACTVLVGSLENDGLKYQTMTSCLMPLSNAHGKHIVSVEGINMEKLSPVQQAMVENNGTQCGFCTVGFVMSLTAFVLSENITYESAITAFDGNICRCTGYKSIERAAHDIVQNLQTKPEKDRLKWLVDNHFIPEYFLNIEEQLRQLKKNDFFTKNTDNQKVIIGGGTDLFVQKAEELRKKQTINFYDQPRLNQIESKNGKCFIGASITVSDIENSELMHSIFPDLKSYTKLVASTPIRNMATIAGNFTNASPIGDMTIFFLALDAEIILNNNHKKRSIKLKDFYLDYKKLDKSPEEFVETIVFEIPGKNTAFNFEKVSKRTHLDIASVNSACLMEVENGTIKKMYLSAGGVGPIPKYLKETSEFLSGKKIVEDSFEEAIKIMQQEISPISDARGSANYKRLLLRQLFIAHMIKFFPQVFTPQRIAAL
jgi:xanthine dehydrogenase small subunit